MKIKYFGTVLIIWALISTSACNSHSTGTHQNHDSHLMKVNEQGDKVMGFSHEKTTHRFRLFADGGAIEVTAKDANDAESRDQIRTHLAHIAEMFAAGNFNAPMLVHGKNPSGVPVLQSRKSEITYDFQEIENGGRVRIKTADVQALTGIQDFLRFQISDHQTGDSAEITKE